MREITADAVRAGAFGFSTSRTIAHKTLAGDHTPTLRAQEAELMGIAMGLKDAGKGFIEMTSDWNTPDPATEFAMVRRVMQACGRPLVFSLNQRHDRTTAWKDLLELSTQAAADGLPVRCVAPPRPIGALLGLSGSQNPFAGTRTYRSIAHLPLAQRVAAMRDPEVQGEDHHRGPERIQHLVAADPHRLRADVPLHRSAELHAGTRGFGRRDRRARGSHAAGGRLRHADRR